MREGDLHLFALAARHGSLSAAGRELGLSPAAASARLTALEKALGAALMARSTRSLSLTEAGARFLGHANAALEALEAGRAALDDASREASGLLRASLPGPFGRKHVLPFLPEFRAAHPRVELDLSLSDRVANIVEEGFDLAVRIGEQGDSSLVRTRLAPNRRMVVASPGLVAEHGRPERPEALADLPAVFQPSLRDWTFVRGEERVSVRVEGPIRADNGAVLLDAAVLGLGIALKSVWDIGAELADGRLVRLLPDWGVEPAGEIVALRPPSPFVPLKVRAFIDLLKARYGPVPYWEEGIAD